MIVVGQINRLVDVDIRVSADELLAFVDALNTAYSAAAGLLHQTRIVSEEQSGVDELAIRLKLLMQQKAVANVMTQVAAQAG
jgi:hypothetical protein